MTRDAYVDAGRVSNVHNQSNVSLFNVDLKKGNLYEKIQVVASRKHVISQRAWLFEAGGVQPLNTFQLRRSFTPSDDRLGRQGQCLVKKACGEKDIIYGDMSLCKVKAWGSELSICCLTRREAPHLNDVPQVVLLGL